MLQDEAECEAILEETPVEKERRVQIKSKVSDPTQRGTQATGVMIDLLLLVAGHWES